MHMESIYYMTRIKSSQTGASDTRYHLFNCRNVILESSSVFPWIESEGSFSRFVRLLCFVINLCGSYSRKCDLEKRIQNLEKKHGAWTSAMGIEGSNKEDTKEETKASSSSSDSESSESSDNEQKSLLQVWFSRCCFPILVFISCTSIWVISQEKNITFVVPYSALDISVNSDFTSNKNTLPFPHWRISGFKS